MIDKTTLATLIGLATPADVRLLNTGRRLFLRIVSSLTGIVDPHAVPGCRP